MMQRLRDEAHRFAINFHREKRSKAMTDSVLDDIAGLGPVRKKALLKKFGSVKQIKLASAEQLCAVAGINPALAQHIVEQLANTGHEMMVNTTTGEIIDL